MKEETPKTKKLDPAVQEALNSYKELIEQQRIDTKWFDWQNRETIDTEDKNNMLPINPS